MIEVRNLTKRFGKLTVLDDISTSFASKEVVSIIGPSGGGKSHLSALLESAGNAHLGTDCI